MYLLQWGWVALSNLRGDRNMAHDIVVKFILTLAMLQFARNIHRASYA